MTNATKPGWTARQHIKYLESELRSIAAISPDFDGEDEDGERYELHQCLEAAKRLAYRALKESSKHVHPDLARAHALSDGDVVTDAMVERAACPCCAKGGTELERTKLALAAAVTEANHLRFQLADEVNATQGVSQELEESRAAQRSIICELQQAMADVFRHLGPPTDRHTPWREQVMAEIDTIKAERDAALRRVEGLEAEAQRGGTVSDGGRG